AGRIGSAYAIMMARGFRMNVIYYSRTKNERLEKKMVNSINISVKDKFDINIRNLGSSFLNRFLHNRF
ncbi:MAG: hypothetical protein WD607_10085, partial [Candidatus Paceibacterota bacterium]